MLSCLGMQQELLRTPVTKPCDWGDVSVFKKYINSIWDLYRWRLQKCTSVTTFLSSETTCQATSDKEESSDKLTLWQFIFFFYQMSDSILAQRVIGVRKSLHNTHSLPSRPPPTCTSMSLFICNFRALSRAGQIYANRSFTPRWLCNTFPETAGIGVVHLASPCCVHLLLWDS